MNFELADKVTIFCWNLQIQVGDKAYTASEEGKKAKIQQKACVCQKKAVSLRAILRKRGAWTRIRDTNKQRGKPQRAILEYDKYQH